MNRQLKYYESTENFVFIYLYASTFFPFSATRLGLSKDFDLIKDRVVFDNKHESTN